MKKHILGETRMNSKSIELRTFVLTIIISFTAIIGSTSSVTAQAICVAETLNVTSVSGRVVSEFNDGEGPLTKASVTLKRGNNTGPVIAKQLVKTDGSFSFDHIRLGKYVMVVSEPGLIDFYLDLQVKRSRATQDAKETVVIMSADFEKPCSGSRAELRPKKTVSQKVHPQ